MKITAVPADRLSPSRLVAIYAGLVAVGYIINALPGLPYFRTAGEGAFAVAIDLVLIFFIARGSQAAIVTAFALNAFLFLAVFLTAIVDVPAPGVIALMTTNAVEMLVLAVLWRSGRHARSVAA